MRRAVWRLSRGDRTAAVVVVEMQLPNGVRFSLPADDPELLAATIVAARSLAAIRAEADAC